MDPKNCWEVKKCGRRPGGENVDELGVCPAATDASKEGVNRGTCAGRYCWRIAGTLCEKKVQGSYAKKLESCINCDFFKQVQEECGVMFEM